jgi:hypothetical protein
MCFIRHTCGDPPVRYNLEILWHEHELGEYATIGITWDGPGDAPWDYISRAEDALQRFDQAVSWSELAPDLRCENDDNEEIGEDEDAEESSAEGESSAESHELIELYRHDGMLEVSLGEWQAALDILQKQGWQPTRPAGRYASPLWFVTQDEGKKMEQAARSLFVKIDNEPVLSASVPMDLGTLYRLMDFLGGGAFVIGVHGSFAKAKANDFSDLRQQWPSWINSLITDHPRSRL